MLMENITQGLTLFMLGMGTVFVLLSVLIFCITIVSSFCRKPHVNGESARPSSNQGADEIEAAKIAVRLHRQAMGL